MLGPTGRPAAGWFGARPSLPSSSFGRDSAPSGRPCGCRWLRRRRTCRNDAMVRIVQPGLRPDSRVLAAEPRPRSSTATSRSRRTDDTAKHVALDDVTMLVWPESAFPFILQRDPLGTRQDRRRCCRRDTYLVTGAARARSTCRPADGRTCAYSDYYNSMLVHRARRRASSAAYDKVHLVPFGEYLPFDSHPACDRPAQLRGDPRRLRVRWRAPLVGRARLAAGGAADLLRGDLFQARFDVGLRRRGRPGCSISPTTAGSAAPADPISISPKSRLRTIEEGLPMIRGAATGISAVDRPLRTRSRVSFPLGPEGIIDTSSAERR